MVSPNPHFTALGRGVKVVVLLAIGVGVKGVVLHNPPFMAVVGLEVRGVVFWNPRFLADQEVSKW